VNNQVVKARKLSNSGLAQREGGGRDAKEWLKRRWF
jgi:hypothetical protein